MLKVKGVERAHWAHHPVTDRWGVRASNLHCRRRRDVHASAAGESVYGTGVPWARSLSIRAPSALSFACRLSPGLDALPFRAPRDNHFGDHPVGDRVEHQSSGAELRSRRQRR